MNTAKQMAVEGLRGNFSKAKSVLLTDYRGLTVAEMNEVRRTLRESSVELKVVKNTLAKIAIKGTGAEVISDQFVGPTAVAFTYEDAVAAAKALTKLAETHDELEIKAGLLGEKLLNLEDIKALSKLPSREVLLAKLLSVMNAVPTGLVNVLIGKQRELVQVLAAIREKKEQEL